MFAFLSAITIASLTTVDALMTANNYVISTNGSFTTIYGGPNPFTFGKLLNSKQNAIVRFCPNGLYNNVSTPYGTRRVCTRKSIAEYLGEKAKILVGPNFWQYDNFEKLWNLSLSIMNDASMSTFQECRIPLEAMMMPGMIADDLVMGNLSIGDHLSHDCLFSVLNLNSGSSELIINENGVNLNALLLNYGPYALMSNFML
jgi:hypothetical protein